MPENITPHIPLTRRPPGTRCSAHGVHGGQPTRPRTLWRPIQLRGGGGGGGGGCGGRDGGGPGSCVFSRGCAHPSSGVTVWRERAEGSGQGSGARRAYVTYCMGAYIKYFTLAYSFQIHSLYTKLGGGPGTKAPDTPADRGWERQIEKGWRGAVVWRGLPPSVKSPHGRRGMPSC